MRLIGLGVLAFTGCATFICAQQTTTKPAGSTVTGHVFLADTNGPARMATVMLQPVEMIDATRTEKKLSKAVSSQSVETLLDGSFNIPNVQPGEYYILASAPGYISPLFELLTADNESQKNADTRKRLAALAPRLVVQANLPASANVTLERGAAVSGTILYDDGSPASDLRVQLLVRKKGEWTAPPSMPFSQSIPSAITDDRGHYRISGLPAQKYALEATLSLQKWMYSANPGGGYASTNDVVFSLPIYSGNQFRKKDAAGFALTQGDEQDGEDIEIPISRLHTVRGNVIAAHDGHLINGGRVHLLYPDDRSELDSTQLTRDGDFNLSFVPEGDYILHVTGAADTEYTEVSNGRGAMPPTHTETHVLHHYGEAEMPIHIAGDMSGVVISAPDAQAQTTMASQ